MYNPFSNFTGISRKSIGILTFVGFTTIAFHLIGIKVIRVFVMLVYSKNLVMQEINEILRQAVRLRLWKTI